MEKLILSDKEHYKKIEKNMIQWWKANLHILADFDRTLTKAFSKWAYRPALISILLEDGYLSKEYQEKAQWFFDYYHPIEGDENLPLQERKNAMQEWREKHKLLLIEEWLTKQDIYKAMKSQNIELRDKSKEFFDLLENNNIPLVILSAWWLGTVSIKKYLENQKSLHQNIYIIWNEFIRDNNDKAIDFKRPVIHTLNKDETAVKNFPEIYKKVKERKNIILLGDSIGDIKMAEWFEYDNILKIWFLNRDIEKNFERYKESFDVLILNDGSMDFVHKVLERICK